MRVSIAVMLMMLSLTMSAPQFGFSGGFGGNRFGFEGGRGGVNGFSSTQNCLRGNCQQNNQNVNFNSGFGGRGSGSRGGGNSFNPQQNCVGGNCQQNNRNVNFNNPLFGK